MPENVLRSFRDASERTTIAANKPDSHKPVSRKLRLWALCIGAAFAVLILGVVLWSIAHPAILTGTQSEQIARSAPLVGAGAKSRTQLAIGSAPAPGATPAAMMDAAPTRLTSQTMGALIHGTADTPGEQQSPTIARTVWLTIIVKDIAASRAALDAVLSQCHGYPAQLTINTPENATRSVQASLRIPAPELPLALGDLRKLGRVQSESQSGEEVTQQHADLVARLRNARETEQRLLDILQKRTGKVAEVLQVEEQISNIRGDIERMEADQKALEHRVDFASVDLQLTEEYEAQLNPPSTSVGTRMHNAFVAGIANAAGSLLAMILFFEEYGPVLLIWIALFGAPLVFLWRRYRAARPVSE